jgi:hypothetical protein
MPEALALGFRDRTLKPDQLRPDHPGRAVQLVAEVIRARVVSR